MDITKRERFESSGNPFEDCERFLNSTDSAYTIAGDWNDKFKDTLNIMFDVVNKLEKDEDIDDFGYQPIEECLNLLTALTLEKQKVPALDRFMEAFIFIAFNINENMEKYPAVQSKIAYLQRYCDDALTFGELIDMTNKVTDRTARWRNWTPPSFRLSQHYYDLIKGE